MVSSSLNRWLESKMKNNYMTHPVTKYKTSQIWDIILSRFNFCNRQSKLMKNFWQVCLSPVTVLNPRNPYSLNLIFCSRKHLHMWILKGSLNSCYDYKEKLAVKGHRVLKVFYCCTVPEVGKFSVAFVWVGQRMATSAWSWCGIVISYLWIGEAEIRIINMYNK